MRTVALITLAGALVLGGCAADEQTGTAVASPASAASAAASTGASAGAGSPAASPDAPAGAQTEEGTYIEYAAYKGDPGAYADGSVVLFFHASWCPDCKRTHESLTSAGVPAGLTVVKVDYDTQTDLKKQYKITHQHTFVAIDADGAQRAKWSGSVTGEEIKAKAQA